MRGLSNWRALVDGDLVEQAVATALGVREQPAVPLLSILKRYLQTRKLLIVIDNCEHVLAACSAIVRSLLSACPRLKISLYQPGSTGRGRRGVLYGAAALAAASAARGDQRLRGTGRHRFGGGGSVSGARAAAARPGIVIDDNCRNAAKRIVHRLDGIPLAIELAAARATVLSVEQIAARLSDAFKLLTQGSRLGPSRQQHSPALCIDWELESVERDWSAGTILRRLSSFAGLDFGNRRGGLCWSRGFRRMMCWM